MSCHLCFAKCLRKLYVWNCMKFSMKCSLTKQAETEANDKSYFARDISLAFFYLLWKGFVSIRAQVIENKHIYIYIYIYNLASSLRQRCVGYEVSGVLGLVQTPNVSWAELNSRARRVVACPSIFVGDHTAKCHFLDKKKFLISRKYFLW